MSKLQKFYGLLSDVLIFGSLASLVWLFSDFWENHQLNCLIAIFGCGDKPSGIINNPFYHFSWTWLVLAILAIVVAIYAKITKKVSEPFGQYTGNKIEVILAISGLSLVLCLMVATFGFFNWHENNGLPMELLLAVGWLFLIFSYCMYVVYRLPEPPAPPPPTIEQIYRHLTDDKLIAKRDQLNSEILRRHDRHSAEASALEEALQSTQ